MRVTYLTDSPVALRYYPIGKTAIAVVRVVVVAVARRIDVIHVIRVAQIRRPRSDVFQCNLIHGRLFIIGLLTQFPDVRSLPSID